jgi:uncharacterized cupredoxin-like copper-binding protein
MKWILAALLGAALVLPVADALAHENHGHNQAIGRPGVKSRVVRTIEVSMHDDMRFVPASIQVKRGETIRLVVRNVGRMKHELMLGSEKDLKEHAAVMQKEPEMEHDEPHAVTVDPGEQRELIWQFTRAGEFRFACLRPGHFEAGMSGELSVR